MNNPESSPERIVPTVADYDCFRDFVEERTRAIQTVQSQLATIIAHARTIKSLHEAGDQPGINQALVDVAAYCDSIST